MRRILLFAYGTLLDAKVQRRVFGRVVEIVPARLAGWRVVARAVQNRFPGIVRTPGKSVTGGLLGIDARERSKADCYEGAPALYQRLRVTVRAGRRPVRCWVYVPAGAGRADVACGRRPGLAGGR